MAVSDFLTPKMIILGATLASLITMTPLCGGKSYDFYERGDKIGLNSTQTTSAIESIVAAYSKEAPGYTLKDKPLYAKTDNPNEFLLLLHPYFGTCAPSCVPALMRITSDGKAEYVRDMETLNCRMLSGKDVAVVCDHSQGLF